MNRTRVRDVAARAADYLFLKGGIPGALCFLGSSLAAGYWSLKHWEGPFKELRELRNKERAVFIKTALARGDVYWRLAYSEAKKLRESGVTSGVMEKAEIIAKDKLQQRIDSYMSASDESRKTKN